MELNSWLKTDINNNFNILGEESFSTFLKVCSEFSQWALDDVGLANRANVYKIWTCKIKSEKIKEVKDILERYSSMKLLLHYYNINIVENNLISLYIKLDFEQNSWMLSYGITNNKKLFKVGEFKYDFNTKLPENEILKYILEEIEIFNPREHLLLYKIKQDAFQFNPGYCQILDPQIINKEIIISTHGLGQWNESNIEKGEPEKYLDILKNWVKEKVWWQNVKLVVSPRQNKWLDFKIVLK